MPLLFRGEYRNPEMVELELEQLDNRILDFPKAVTTLQRDLFEGVRAGTLVFNTTTGKLNVYTGSTWEVVTSS